MRDWLARATTWAPTGRIRRSKGPAGWVGPALDGVGEFPGEVERVLDEGVGAQAAGGRVPVHGVAAAEDPPLE